MLQRQKGTEETSKMCCDLCRAKVVILWPLPSPVTVAPLKWPDKQVEIKASRHQPSGLNMAQGGWPSNPVSFLRGTPFFVFIPAHIFKGQLRVFVEWRRKHFGPFAEQSVCLVVVVILWNWSNSTRIQWVFTREWRQKAGNVAPSWTVALFWGPRRWTNVPDRRFKQVCWRKPAKNWNSRKDLQTVLGFCEWFCADGRTLPPPVTRTFSSSLPDAFTYLAKHSQPASPRQFQSASGTESQVVLERVSIRIRTNCSTWSVSQSGTSFQAPWNPARCSFLSTKEQLEL